MFGKQVDIKKIFNINYIFKGWVRKGAQRAGSMITLGFPTGSYNELKYYNYVYIHCEMKMYQ